MTTPPFSDEAVERLLRDFFAREMPADLRALPDRSPSAVDGPLPVPASTRPRRWSGWRTGLAALSLAACGLLVAVVLTQTDISQSDNTATHPRVAGPANDSAPVAQDAPARAHPAPVTGDPHAGHEPPLIIVDDAVRSGRRRPVDRREPVEARSSRQWTTVGEAGDERGPRTDYSAPNEITVEILPLEGDPVQPRTPPQAPDDPRLPEERRSDP